MLEKADEFQKIQLIKNILQVLAQKRQIQKRQIQKRQMKDLLIM